MLQLRCTAKVKEQLDLKSKDLNAKEAADQLNIPVYFLGGMTLKDLDKTLKLGAQGIAGVSAF
jgi:thiamine monophosphate synthase